MTERAPLSPADSNIPADSFGPSPSQTVGPYFHQGLVLPDDAESPGHRLSPALTTGRIELRGRVRGLLVPRDERTVGTLTVEQEREISADGRFVRKTITIGELGRTFVERVRLFEPSELVALCTQAGFTVDAVLGDYDGTAMRPDAPRTILFARRP